MTFWEYPKVTKSTLGLIFMSFLAWGRRVRRCKTRNKGEIH